MRHIFLYISLIGTTVAAWALDAQQELNKIAALHNQLQNYKVHTTYRLYENATAMNALEVFKGTEYKQGKNTMSTLAGMTTLYLKNEYLLIDSVEKQILITYKPENIKTMGRMDFNFDTLKKAFTQIEAKEIDAQLRVLTFKAARKGTSFNEMDKVSLYYDVTYHLKKVVLYYGYTADVKNQMKQGDKPRIEITYSAYSLGLSPAELARLQRNHYLNTVKGKLSGVGSYASYEIIDGRYKK